MLDGVKKAFLEVVTNAKDAHDVGRWSWLICTAAALAVIFYELTHRLPTDQPVGVKDVAFALSSIAISHGVALGAKAGSE